MTLLAQFAATGGGVANYIEDVFSTYLFTGTGAALTITNNIDLSTKGGLVWIKDRDSGAKGHAWFDTARGVNKKLQSQSTGAEFSAANQLTAFNTTGFALGTDTDINGSGTTYASWTFRKQPKFFDVVTYTGTGSNTTIAHSLGSIPGCIMVKRTDTSGAWQVYHRANTANPETDYLVLNTTAATADSDTRWNDTQPTSAVFSLGTDATVNASGGTYVAYLWAHDAGGFGLSGSDNVISCGSYTGIAYPTSLEVTLGYEPQFVIIKNSTTVSGWAMWDIARGMTVVPAVNTAQSLLLEPNTAAVESNQPGIYPTATGFVVKNGLTSISGSGDTMVYIAIRRGPMKVPTTGTSVYGAVARSGTSAVATVTGLNFPPDAIFTQTRNINYVVNPVFDRLRGAPAYLVASQTNAENSADPDVFKSFNMNGVTLGNDVANNGTNRTGYDYINWFFGRAPSYFDVVCYTGNNVSGRTITHNLAAVPQLMIVKSRTSGTRDWIVYDATNGATKYMNLNNTSASGAGSFWVSTAPTSTVFTVSDSASVNDPAQNYVAYLFSTCAGVSKVGSYTGTATTKQIDCGFTAGARFVLIKRTDSTGDWYVYDSTRGIVAGNDPYLLINQYLVEVTGTDYVDTYAAGFELSSTAPAALNASGGTYIFLAIA